MLSSLNRIMYNYVFVNFIYCSKMGIISICKNYILYLSRNSCLNLNMLMHELPFSVIVGSFKPVCPWPGSYYGWKIEPCMCVMPCFMFIWMNVSHKFHLWGPTCSHTSKNFVASIILWTWQASLKYKQINKKNWIVHFLYVFLFMQKAIAVHSK